ncbi:rRNA maturation RNase YbeY [Loktanella sp. IMCC34160]|uniref:rRNA maturation RNase YbeY n=1 Tax=Loktanella sp. IMCC34160 TaxID=2510646 RepID=UPI00101BEAD3|nr:rRNA maturation RNase YbeY [Loktanella sp. IMCC34160]RYG90615.1 rRNA maturation RNase YbeY [Loktanella sp. IMCC34160]
MTADISIDIADPRWADVGFDDLVATATEAVLDHLGLSDDCELSVLACDDARIAGLNTEFRGKAVPTNVLSWPAEERGADAPGARPDLPEPDMFGTVELGDIAISYDTCAREAAEAGKPLADHTTHLVVHGVLHLLGYDHIRDPDATLMEGLEVEILGKLGVPDPYYRED